MCGHDWCAVRISKEITEFVSGKDDAYAWDAPAVSAALTPEQRAILERRGVLAPAEIHRLAGKTRRAMGGDRGRASCHSDVVSDAQALELQSRELDPVTLEPLA
jgi:phosphomethylpyrimidine synthase